MALELYQIRHFAAIVETGSFTKAAIRSSVSQPALSTSIAKLEEELSVLLFYRGPKGVSLSKAGKRFHATAVEVLASCSKLKADLRASATEQTLRIGVLRTLPTAQLIGLLETLRQGLPDVSIELIDGNCDELNTKLTERKVVATITCSAEDLPHQSSAALGYERYALVVALDHRLANFDTAGIKDLHGERFIVRTHCETYHATSRRFVEHGIKTRIVFRTDQDDRALALVASGFGVALMPLSYVAQNVHKVMLRDFNAERVVKMCWNSDCNEENLMKAIALARSHNLHI